MVDYLLLLYAHFCNLNDRSRYFIWKTILSGAANPLCKFGIVMGKTGTRDTPRHRNHSMIIVPFDTPGVTRVRNLSVFGYDGKL